jgi:hypothetical protein
MPTESQLPCNVNCALVCQRILYFIAFQAPLRLSKPQFGLRAYLNRDRIAQSASSRRDPIPEHQLG